MRKNGMDPLASDSTLEIRAPARFSHVGGLAARETSHDPRSERFPFSNVTIDLRGCLHIDTPAMLWCVVFLTLAGRRGATCELRLPDDAGASDALASSGIGDILTAAGVNLEDCHSANMSSMLLPVCVMQSFRDVERMADHILDKLMAAGGSGLSSLYSTITETFVELANNGVEHSQSEIGTLGLVALHTGRKMGSFEIGIADSGVGIGRTLRVAADLDKNRRQTDWSSIEYATGELVSGRKMGSFEIGIADSGVGIGRTLRVAADLDKNRRQTDWSSIEYATGELVSGTGDPHRGIGLFGVAEDSRMPGAVLRLQSGRGGLHINQSSEIRATRNSLFPGTLAYVSIRFPAI